MVISLDEPAHSRAGQSGLPSADAAMFAAGAGIGLRFFPASPLTYPERPLRVRNGTIHHRLIRMTQRKPLLSRQAVAIPSSPASLVATTECLCANTEDD